MLYSYPDCSCRSDAATAQQPTPCNVYCRSEQDGFNQQKILTTMSMAWEHFSLQFEEICANCITLSGLLTFGVIDIFR